MKEELLYKNFQSKIDLSEEEFEQIVSKFEPLTLEKKKNFLRPGDYTNHLAFVRKGALRSYEIDSRGNENVLQLAFEDHWTSDLRSFILRSKSKIYVETIEDSELLLLSHSNLEALYLDVPRIERFFRKLYEKAYVHSQERIQTALHVPAEQRYRNIMKKYPGIIQRIPLIYIASYLGITPESLSRIRRKI